MGQIQSQFCNITFSLVMGRFSSELGFKPEPNRTEPFFRVRVRGVDRNWTDGSVHRFGQSPEPFERILNTFEPELFAINSMNVRIFYSSYSKVV